MNFSLCCISNCFAVTEFPHTYSSWHFTNLWNLCSFLKPNTVISAEKRISLCMTDKFRPHNCLHIHKTCFLSFWFMSLHYSYFFCRNRSRLHFYSYSSTFPPLLLIWNLHTDGLLLKSNWKLWWMSCSNRAHGSLIPLPKTPALHRQDFWHTPTLSKNYSQLQ